MLPGAEGCTLDETLAADGAGYATVRYTASHVTLCRFAPAVVAVLALSCGHARQGLPRSSWRADCVLCAPVEIRCDQYARRDALTEYWANPVGDPGDFLDEAIRTCWLEAPPSDWQVSISSNLSGTNPRLVDVPSGGIDVEWMERSGTRVLVQFENGESGWVDKDALCRFYLDSD